MTRLVYPLGVSDATPPVPVVGCASAPMAKNIRRGRGLKPQSSGRGGNCPLKVTLVPSVVNGWQPGYVLSPGLRPAVRRPVMRIKCSINPELRAIERNDGNMQGIGYQLGRLPTLRHALAFRYFLGRRLIRD